MAGSGGVQRLRVATRAVYKTRNILSHSGNPWVSPTIKRHNDTAWSRYWNLRMSRGQRSPIVGHVPITIKVWLTLLPQTPRNPANTNHEFSPYGSEAWILSLKKWGWAVSYQLIVLHTNASPTHRLAGRVKAPIDWWAGPRAVDAKFSFVVLSPYDCSTNISTYINSCRPRLRQHPVMMMIVDITTVIMIQTRDIYVHSIFLNLPKVPIELQSSKF